MEWILSFFYVKFIYWCKICLLMIYVCSAPVLVGCSVFWIFVVTMLLNTKSVLITTKQLWWPVCEFDLTLRVLFLVAAFKRTDHHHCPPLAPVSMCSYCLPNPCSFCKTHYPSVVQCYLVHWLNILFIAWPVMRVQRGFVFYIAWNLWGLKLWCQVTKISQK